MINMDVGLIVLSVGAILLHNNRGLGLAMEADCSASQSTATEIVSSYSTVPEFPFRADRVTREECRKYKYLIPCSPVGQQLSCNHVRDNDWTMFDPRSRTYLVIECSERDRSEMLELVRNVSGVSPTRAISLTLQERDGADDPFHADVFAPIGNQMIEFKAKCAAKTITSKVYNVGILPNLLRLEIHSGRNLTIGKDDFTRLPRILMISFETSTIEVLERGTFSNLPTLQSLLLESGWPWQLKRQAEDKALDVYGRVDLFKGWDVEKLRRLHCDCTFAWLRNFIKEKSELFERKRQGEVFIVGNYQSPLIDDIGMQFRAEMQFLSVDCSRNLTHTNINAGSEFSYNTSCHTC